MARRDIEIKVNASATISLLSYGGRQLDYATANIVNAAALAAQVALRKRVRAAVTVRKPAFIDRQIAVIKPFASASQSRYFAVVSVGVAQRLFLADLEAGGLRRPTTGAKAIAAPITGTPARPSFSTAQSFPPLIRRLGFKPQPSGGRARGRRRAALQKILEGSLETWQTSKGVFQRTGPHTVRALYLFIRAARLRPALRWVQTARAAIEATVPVAARREVDLAFKHSLGGP